MIMIFTSMPDGSVYFNAMLYVRSRSCVFMEPFHLTILFCFLVCFLFRVFYITSSSLDATVRIHSTACIYATNEIKFGKVLCRGPQVHSGMK